MTLAPGGVHSRAMDVLRFFVVLAVVAAGASRADFYDHFAQREDIGPHKVPYLGPARVLVIPVEVSGAPPIDLARVQRFFTPDEPGGFVDYYHTASVGRYQPEVTISPIVHFDSCPLPPESFPNCAVPRGDIAAFTPGMNMMREVIKRADALGVDFTQLDVNGRKGVADGFADGVMILTNIKFGGIAFPFAYYNRDDNLAGGMGGALIVDGIKIPMMAIAGELDTYTMVHEFGHLLGLTDLYDETGAYDGLHFTWMGAWNYDPDIPLPDAESRYRLRWADVVQATGPARFRIPPVEQSGRVIRLGTGPEYFLVENRGPGGRFDREFTARGLVVYHVDRTIRLQGEEGRFLDRILNCVQCDPWRPYIRDVQADGRFELQHGGAPNYEEDLFRDGDVLAPDESGQAVSVTHQVQSTNYYSGEQSGLAIRDIEVLEDGTIEASFIAPKTDACTDVFCPEGVGCKPINCGAQAPDEIPEGCGCSSSTGTGALFAWIAALALAFATPRRRGATSCGRAPRPR